MRGKIMSFDQLLLVFRRKFRVQLCEKRPVLLCSLRLTDDFRSARNDLNKEHIIQPSKTRMPTQPHLARLLLS